MVLERVGRDLYMPYKEGNYDNESVLHKIRNLNKVISVLCTNILYISTYMINVVEIALVFLSIFSYDIMKFLRDISVLFFCYDLFSR